MLLDLPTNTVTSTNFYHIKRLMLFEAHINGTAAGSISEKSRDELSGQELNNSILNSANDATPGYSVITTGEGRGLGPAKKMRQ